MVNTIDTLRQHQLVILRRLRQGPLTEFELSAQIVEHSGFTSEQCGDNMVDWLDELKSAGLIWAGTLTNASEQSILAAALTRQGKELVG